MDDTKAHSAVGLTVPVILEQYTPRLWRRPPHLSAHVRREILPLAFSLSASRRRSANEPGHRAGPGLVAAFIALISIALNPVLFAAIEPLRRWILERSEVARRLEQRTDPYAVLALNKKTRRSGFLIVGSLKAINPCADHR